MDTLTHALSGALVGRLLAATETGPTTSGAPSRTLGPKGWAAVIAGAAAAAFPDIDFVLGYVSEVAYLRGHRGVTHSLLLLPLWALLLSWLFAALSRRGAGGRRKWRDFYAISACALLIHILGDLITQFGTMIFAPLSDRRFGWGFMFIIDLVLTGVLVAGLAASAIWRRSRLPAAAALALAICWIGVAAIGRSEAMAVARDYATANHIEAVRIDAVPRPVSPFNWTAIVFDGERYHYAHINTRRRDPLEARRDDGFLRRLSAPYRPVAMAQWQTRPQFGDGETGSFAREAWSAPDFAFFRWFAMFPVVDHAEKSAPNEGCAAFRDLRFEMPGRDELPFRYGLCKSEEHEARTGSGWRLYELVAGARRWLAVN